MLSEAVVLCLPELEALTQYVKWGRGMLYLPDPESL